MALAETVRAPAPARPDAGSPAPADAPPELKNRRRFREEEDLEGYVIGWPSVEMVELAYEHAQGAFDDPASPALQVEPSDQYWSSVVTGTTSDELLEPKLEAFEAAIKAAGGIVVARAGVNSSGAGSRSPAGALCPRCSERLAQEERPERSDWAVCWFVGRLPHREVRRLAHEQLGTADAPQISDATAA